MLPTCRSRPPGGRHSVATRDELYAKFGVTAEAAQLFETELGPLILCVRGLEEGWQVIRESL